jgi:hypothetical protein
MGAWLLSRQGGEESPVSNRHRLLLTSRERAARAVGEEESFAFSGSLRRPIGARRG